MRLTAQRVATRRLDEDDVRSEIAEHAPGDRSGLAREVDDAQSVEQWLHAFDPRNLSLTPASAYISPRKGRALGSQALGGGIAPRSIAPSVRRWIVR